VRNIGKINGSSVLSDNDWEDVRKKSSTHIKRWINRQMSTCSCLVVLIGSQTSSREWVKYEIEKAYKLKKGIVGIRIHKLKDQKGKQSRRGRNPFYSILNEDRKRLSNFITVYDSHFSSSIRVYQDIEENMEQLIEKAIVDRKKY
jgi:ribosomal protein S24E